MIPTRLLVYTIKIYNQKIVLYFITYNEVIAIYLLVKLICFRAPIHLACCHIPTGDLQRSKTNSDRCIRTVLLEDVLLLVGNAVEVAELLVWRCIK